MIEHSELKVGLITILGVILFAFAVFTVKDLSLQKRTFGHITVRFDNVRGLASGSLVYLQGVRVGKVLIIRHTANNRVEADLQIRGEYAGKIQKGSAFTIFSVGAISNEKYIDITPPATGNNEFLDLAQQPLMVVDGESSPGFNEVLSSARNILNSVEKEGILAILGNDATQASASQIITYLTSSGKNLSNISLRFNRILKNQEKSLEDFLASSKNLAAKLTAISTRLDSKLNNQVIDRLVKNSQLVTENLAALTGVENQNKVHRILEKSDRVSKNIEALLANLDKDGQLSSDVRAAVTSFKNAATSAREVSDRVQGYLKSGDLDKKLKETVQSAKEMASAVDNFYDNLKKTEVTASYFLKHDSSNDNIHSDIFVSVYNQGRFLYHLGVETIGDDPDFNLILEQTKKAFRLRGGIITSKVGFGFRTTLSSWFRWGLDFYDTVSPKLRLVSQFRLNPEFDIKVRIVDINHEERRITESGIFYHF